MSTETDQAREIAERIARRVAGGGQSSGSYAPKSEVSSEIAAVRAGINDLQRKLAQLEAKVASDPTAKSAATNQPSMISDATSTGRRSAPATHSPWLAGINTSYSHPSEEKFGVEEATVSALVDFFEKEKLCSVEPGGKPCDHCAMCSSRGF